MSGRLLRKVLEEQELQKRGVVDEDEEHISGDESESPDAGGRYRRNPFDLLNEDVDEGGDSPEQVDEPVDISESFTSKKEQSLQQAAASIASRPNQKSKKKKKKKNKEATSGTDKDEESVETLLESVSLDVNSSSNQQSSAKAKTENAKVHDYLVKQTMPYILQVDSKHLNAENELRRIFGAKVVKSFEKSTQSSSSRPLRGGRRGSQHNRKTVLITPSDHWPRWDGSFYMEFVESKDGYQYFRYAHSSSYNQAQKAFEAAQANHNLNGVANVLRRHPYHLDSLIAMADYFRFVGEHQQSADAIAMCLYALECAWHPMFTPFQGNCQVKFSHDTNKPLFKALFTHMRNLDRRGCHRSALEVCKLLLALDSDDPMGAMFCIDYYAIRAEEYAWLERFSKEYKSDNSLWLFPNFSYSLAICRLYLEQEESSHDACTNEMKSSSADLMSQALMLHPSVLKKLVDKVPLKDRAWENILKKSLFRTDKAAIPSLDHLIHIFVERSYLIWRLPDVQRLLRETALTLIETLEKDSSEAKNWECVRREAFSSKKNEYAHLLVQDFSDAMPTLPPELQNVVMVDPREPMQMGHPPDLQNLMMVDPRDAEQMGNHMEEPLNGWQAPPLRNLANRNQLAVLLESMLPWVNYGDAGDAIAADEQNQPDDADRNNENP